MPRTRSRPDLMRIAAVRRTTAALCGLATGAREAAPASRRARRRDRGQSLVEFSLVLMPLFLLILGVVQFGLIFNSYVTMTNAAREGARTGTIYVYDPVQQLAIVHEDDALLVVGTSGLVYPAAGLPMHARAAGARVIPH